MKILHKPGSIQADVPTEDEATNTEEGMSNE